MNRVKSVDVFRLIAIVAVIVIHTSPFNADVLIENEIYKYLDVLLNQTSRFAVPFFFIVSGYFWGLKVRSSAKPLSCSINMGRRVFLILIAWSVIYLLPLNSWQINDCSPILIAKVTYWNLIVKLRDPLTLMMEGTSVHLWFMVALLCAILVATIFVSTGRIKLLVAVSIVLYLVGVFGRSYANTPIGLNIHFDTRNGPFFSTLFFVSGYLLSGRNANNKWLLYGFLIFVVGCFFHFFEIYMLWKLFGTDPKQDYVISTYFMGLGFSMGAFSNHPAFQSSFFSRVGQLTLGIYAVHLLYVDLFRSVDKISDSVLWEMGYVLIVLVLSTITSFVLSKNKFTKRIVT